MSIGRASCTDHGAATHDSTSQARRIGCARRFARDRPVGCAITVRRRKTGRLTRGVTGGLACRLTRGQPGRGELPKAGRTARANGRSEGFGQ